MGRTQPLPLFILKGHEGTIASLHFTTEKDHAIIAQPSLISGSDCGEIFIWSLENNRTYHRFIAHDKNMILFLYYYKSSLLSQGRDGMINVWNYTNCEWIVMRKFSYEGVGFCASEFFSGDSNAFLFTPADEKYVIKVYSYDTGNSWCRLDGTKSAGMCMCMKVFQLDEKIFLLIGYESGFISLWDCESEIELCCRKFHNDLVTCLDFESKHFVKGMSGSVDKDLETWTITKDFQLEKVLQVQITNPGINSVKIRHDGKIVITAGWDNNVRVFSWKSLRPLAVIQFHSSSVQCLAFCASLYDKTKPVFASGSKDKNIALWSLY